MVKKFQKSYRDSEKGKQRKKRFNEKNPTYYHRYSEYFAQWRKDHPNYQKEYKLRKLSPSHPSHLGVY